MLEPLRELSAAQFPSFLLHELIVEQGMFKLYYVSTFVSRYWQIFKKRVNECTPCTGILEIIVCQFEFCIDRQGDAVNRRNWNLKISSRFHLGFNYFGRNFDRIYLKGLDWKCPSLRLFFRSWILLGFRSILASHPSSVKIYGAVA